MPALDYYTLDQAANNSECSTEDILYFLETEKLEANLFSGTKQFLLLSLDPDSGNYKSHAVVTYRGLLRVPSPWIDELLEKEVIEINFPISPLNPENISIISRSDPFEEILPDPVSCWDKGVPENTETYSLMSLPTQRISNTYNAMQALNSMQALMKEMRPDSDFSRFNNSSAIPKYIFDFELNGTFKLSDIRIAHDSISKCQEISYCFKSTEAPKPITGLFWCEGKKSTRIDEVIERLFQENRHESAKILWRYLMHDINEDIFNYDKDEIISIIDADSFEWRNIKGKYSELKFATFANKLSQIKAFYKSNNLQI